MLRPSVLVVGALAFTFATTAMAQVSGSVSLLSDYRFRGVSFSSGDPAAQADISYDAANGWYAGAFASTIKFDAYRSLNRLLVTYAGYARRIAPDLSVDAGASYADLSAGSDLDYLELHAGLTARLVSAQLSYAPRYFGQPRAATYLELNGGTQLTETLRLVAHVGAFYMQTAPSSRTANTKVDGRVGVRYEYGAFAAQLSQVAVSAISGIYPVGYSQHRRATVVQVTMFF